MSLKTFIFKDATVNSSKLEKKTIPSLISDDWLASFFSVPIEFSSAQSGTR